MTFLSGLAALLAILLMVFGVNLSGLDGAPTPTSQPTASIGPESSMMAGETTPVPQATYEVPAPTGAAVVTDSWLDEDAARADAQSLLTALYGGMMGESYTAPAFVVDNMDTHLAARWVDYMRARMALSDEVRLVSFNRPGVVPTLSGMQAVTGQASEQLRVTTVCQLSLNTAAGSEYSKQLTLALTYEHAADGTQSVVAIDIEGDADYDALRQAASGCTTIAEMDAAVDAAIAALG